MLNADIIRSLKCPDCQSDLIADNAKKSLLCDGKKRHCFDFASSGYINLSHTSNSGDSKEAVRSRKLFLDAGHYKCFSYEICDMVASYKKDALVADMGCGEGYYSVNLLSSLPDAKLIGLDLSKHAVESAAKFAKRSGCADRSLFAVSSVFDSPIKSNSCDVVINLFAPCSEKEYMRVLKKDGVLIVVGAGPDHLIELKSAIYDIPRRNDERKDLPCDAPLLEKRTLRYSFIPTNDERRALFEMTPYFYRTSLSDKERLERSEPFPITAEFDINVFINK